MLSRWFNPLRSAGRDVVAAVAHGYEAFEAEDWPRAGDLLAAVAPRVPRRAAKAVWFGAALAFKFARDWPRALETGKTAVTYVQRGAEEPAYWNLGTAATVLRDWETARDAWIGSPPPAPGPTCTQPDAGPARAGAWGRPMAFGHDPWGGVLRRRRDAGSRR
ncbi:hypothetical protein [Dactylosporangium sp. NPDC050588]|uniref:hypothetical protein n=1 Tax=Dactylosporangium sp. NPDC050588 TaxID=3157211 RepID=UPI0033E042D2